MTFIRLFSLFPSCKSDWDQSLLLQDFFFFLHRPLCSKFLQFIFIMEKSKFVGYVVNRLKTFSQTCKYHSMVFWFHTGYVEERIWFVYSTGICCASGFLISSAKSPGTVSSSNRTYLECPPSPRGPRYTMSDLVSPPCLWTSLLFSILLYLGASFRLFFQFTNSLFSSV